MNIAVVGCNRGIGLELVRELTKDHQVFAFCRKSSSDLEKIGPTRIIQNFEVTNRKAMETSLKNLALPPLDVLYHVAGIMRSTSLENFDIEAIMEEFKINSVAPIETSIAFLPYLRQGAKIGLMTSRMGSITDNTSGGSYGYRMSKTALNSAGKSLAEDLKPRQISVFLLHPGWVKTDMTNHTGHLTTTESARGLIQLMERKTFTDTGTFWHVSGESLPW